MISVKLHDETFEESYEVFENLIKTLRKGEPRTLLCNLRDFDTTPNAEQRSKAFNLIKSAQPVFEAKCLASAVVVKTTLQKGVLTAMGWFVNLEHPFKVFTSAEEAKDWLETYEPEETSFVLGKLGKNNKKVFAAITNNGEEE